MEKLIKQILHSLNIRLPIGIIRETLLTHQSYPTLSCISDALDYWQIKHSIARLTLEQLYGVNLPIIISSLSSNKAIQIVKISDTDVLYRDTHNRLRKSKKDLFNAAWNGISIIIESPEDNTNNRTKLIQEKYSEDFNVVTNSLFITLLIVFSLLLACGICDGSFTQSIWHNYKSILLINNLLGLFACCLLYRKEKSLNVWGLDRLCKIGTVVDCDKVTKSVKSNYILFHYITEIGIAYFIASIIYTLLYENDYSSSLALHLYFVASLPIVVWSILKQVFYVKKICILCCIVSLTLIANVCHITYLFPIQNVLMADLVHSAITLVFIFISAAIGLITLSNYRQLKNRYYQLSRENASIKFSPTTFNAHLSERSIKTPEIGFIWGNTNSPHEIAIYVSTSCNHCKKLLNELYYLMDIYRNFNYKIIFDIRINDANSDKLKIINFLYTIYLRHDRTNFFSTLDKFYKSHSQMGNSIKCDMTSCRELEDSQFTKSQIEFCETLHLDYSPAILIDGHILSTLYNYKDLTKILQFLSTY